MHVSIFNRLEPAQPLPFCRMGASGTSLHVATRSNEGAATSRLPESYQHDTRYQPPCRSAIA